jgi:ribosome modulation factor/uncharacterized protein (UPF0335 family)
MTKHPKPTPKDHNDESGLTLIYVDQIDKAESVLATARSALQTVYKRAKADGIDIDALKAVRAELKKLEADVLLHENNKIKYGIHLEIARFRQMDLFATPEVDEASVVERAYGLGVQAGKLGKTEGQMPYDSTSAAGQRWLEGHRDGQKLLSMAFKEYSAPRTPTPLEEAAEADESEDESDEDGSQSEAAQ